MGMIYGPSITTQGLVLNFDAAATRSYPGSGTSWTDTTGSGTVLTSTGAPSYTTLGGARCFQFTTTGQYWSGTFSGLQPTVNLTIESWIYPQTDVSAGDYGTIFLLSGTSAAYMSFNKSNRKLAGYWYNHPTDGYHESGAALSNNTWNHLVNVWDNSAATVYQYTNGTQTSVAGPVGNSATGTAINIGQESLARQFAGGIALVRMYYTALSSTQVTQHYNAMRGRFGV